MSIQSADYKVRDILCPLILSHVCQNYSVVLVVPDFYERAYVRELGNLLLMTMGFKQLCAQQVGIRT